MFLGHDATWWALVLAILTAVFTFPPGNLIVQALTNICQDRIASFGKNSLGRRINKLEARLLDLEKLTPLNETENYILWGITSVRLLIMGSTNVVLLSISYATSFLADGTNKRFEDLRLGILGYVVLSFVSMLRERYKEDYRALRDPRRKPALVKQIAELKQMYETWPGRN